MLLVEADTEVLGEVGPRDRGSLGLDLGVHLAPLSGMPLYPARMGGGLGSALLADDAQFEGTARARMRAASAATAAVRAPIVTAGW